MNSEVIQALGMTQGIKFPSKPKKLNTLAINIQGLIITFSDDYKLSYIFTKPVAYGKENKAKIIKQPLKLLSNQYDTFLECHFTSISFNNNGMYLLLYSNNYIGIIELNYISKDGYNLLGDNNFNIIYKTTNQNEKIVDVKFHPYDSYTICILLEKGCFIVMNILTKQCQYIPLSYEYEFNSFCYGPMVDWLYCSIFMINKKGEVFVLCPVTPSPSGTGTGTSDSAVLVSEEVIEDMYLWLEELRLASNSVLYSGGEEEGSGEGVVTTSDEIKEYISIAKTYLLSNFKATASASSANGDDDGDDNEQFTTSLLPSGYIPTTPSTNSYSLNHPHTTGSGFSGTRHQSSVRIPSLQGPFKKVATSELSSTNQHRVATDITVPYTNNTTSAVPIVIIAYDNGDIESYFLQSTTASTSSAVGPAWLPSHEEQEGQNYDPYQYTCPVPSMLLVEKINLVESLVASGSGVALESGGSAAAPWTLIADPGTHIYVLYTCIY